MKRTNLLSIGIILLSFIACVHEPIPPDGGTGGGNDTTGNGGGDTTGNGGENPQPCDPDSVYFENDILPLLISNCAMSGCHDAQSAEDGVILTNWQTVTQTADVRPGDPTGSDLYEVLVEDDSDKIMPPPPESPLSQQQINLIYTWIAQGARNNSCGDCDTSNVTYSQTIRPLINQWCVGCHGGSFPSDGIDLTTYTALYNVAVSGQLIGTTHSQPGYPTMPQGSQLSDCEKEQLLIWVQDGAPNN